MTVTRGHVTGTEHTMSLFSTISQPNVRRRVATDSPRLQGRRRPSMSRQNLSYLDTFWSPSPGSPRTSPPCNRTVSTHRSCIQPSKQSSAGSMASSTASTSPPQTRSRPASTVQASPRVSHPMRPRVCRACSAMRTAARAHPPSLNAHGLAIPRSTSIDHERKRSWASASEHSS